MQQSILRKPVPDETESTFAKPSQIPQGGTPGGVSERNAPLTPAELDENLQDMEYLGPMVSRLNIKDSPAADGRDSENAEANDNTTFASKIGKIITSPLSSSKIKRSSLDKPLPKPPAGQIDADDPLAELPAHPGVRPFVKAQPRPEHTFSRDITSAADLDLRDSEDTTVTTKWARAVTHETIKQNVHEHQQESVTREIHEHEVFHRILPIIDVEVLPARHYVATEIGLQEVPEHRVPGRITSADAQRLLAKSSQTMLPKAETAPGPRQFTARSFPDKEGDYKESVSSTGTKQTERWWVHPPTLEEGARASGQTRPLHLK